MKQCVIVLMTTIQFTSSLGESQSAGTKCGLFQEANVTTKQCECIKLSVYGYDCERQELTVGMCMTYNGSTPSTGLCPYQYDFNGNMTLDVENFKLKLSMSSGECADEQQGSFDEHSTSYMVEAISDFLCT